MRIVMIHTHFDYLDGSTRFLLEIFKHLKILGNSVSILCLDVKPHVISEYLEPKNSILSLNEPPPRSIRFWLKLPMIQRRVKKILNKNQPDAVVANIFPCQYLLPDIGGVSNVWYCHEPSAYIYRTHSITNLSVCKRTLINKIKMFLSCYDRHKVSRIEKIACNSYFTANLVYKIYRKTPVVIYPGVDAEKFRPIMRKRVQPKILLSVGPLVKSKRLDFVLYIARALSTKHKNFRVVMVGNGPEYSHLANLANILNISNLVEFRGYLPEYDLIKLYSEATAVIYPSIEEPFGLVPLEAMACGTPVIACRPGGPSETILNGKTGFLVDSYDMKQLTEKIDFLLSNPNFAEDMGVIARRYVLQKFSWRRAAIEISELCKP